jgi:alkylated DNA repair protein (DNA oxidative demethylase)
VAGACAANSLAVIVPCHRVVREDGALSGYRWGTARKAQLLAREAQRGGVMLDLFSDTPPWQEPLAPARWCFAALPASAPGLLQAIADVARQSPFRQMVTPGGYTMSVAMTNCGGWAGPPIATATSTPRSIRSTVKPGRRCLPYSMNWRWRQRGRRLSGLFPDACLINRYQPGAKLSLHQDKDEQDLRAPIVSVSWACRPSFSLAGCSAATRCSGCCWSMAMWWSGAASRACFIMAFSR